MPSGRPPWPARLGPPPRHRHRPQRLPWGTSHLRPCPPAPPPCPTSPSSRPWRQTRRRDSYPPLSYMHGTEILRFFGWGWSTCGLAVELVQPCLQMPLRIHHAFAMDCFLPDLCFGSKGGLPSGQTAPGSQVLGGPGGGFPAQPDGRGAVKGPAPYWYLHPSSNRHPGAETPNSS